MFYDGIGIMANNDKVCSTDEKRETGKADQQVLKSAVGDWIRP